MSMQQINITESADDALQKINSNLLECGAGTSVSQADTATSLCTKLNGVFDGMDGIDILSTAQSASSFVASVNKNFGIAEGSTPDVPIDDSDLAEIPSFSFIHISDTHGTYGDTTTLETCFKIMSSDSNLYDSSIQCLIHTGDLQHYAGSNTAPKWADSSHPLSAEVEAMYDAESAPEYKRFVQGYEFYTVGKFYRSGKHFLFANGNHDNAENIYHFASKCNVAEKDARYFFRDVVEDWMSASGAVFGNNESETVTDNNGNTYTGMKRGLYWHKDYILNSSRKLRIIGLDLYNSDKNTGRTYTNKISAEQGAWFVARLGELNPQDFFIIALHEPPIYDQETLDERTPTGKYRYRTAMRSVNPFNSLANPSWSLHRSVSSEEDQAGQSDFGQGMAHTFYFILDIVDAYLGKKSVNTSSSSRYHSTDYVPSIQHTFTKNPATFLCYLAGHWHYDNIQYNNEYPSQLICSIDTAQPTKKNEGEIRAVDVSSYTDDYKSLGSGNKITIDFANKRLIIERQNGLNNTYVSRRTVDRTLALYNYDAHEDGFVYGVDDTYVKGGGYIENSTYYATNRDGSVNDDVDYIKLDEDKKITHILTYTYENGAIVETVTDANGNVLNDYTVDRTEFYLRRKKVSFPFKRTT